MKKLISIALAAILLLALVPFNVFAETFSGECGENLTWSLDTSTGVLTISGTGEMEDYDWFSAPWDNNSDYIKSVVIENGVASIGIGAFANCTEITSISVDKNNTFYHSNGNCIIETESKTLVAGIKISTIPSDGSVTSIGDYAFIGCNGLTSITIPDSVTSIGDYAFSNCSGLTTINIPDSVTSIGDYAFSRSTKLTSITIPDSVTSIGEWAFYYCTELTNITVNENNTVYHSNGNCLIETESKTLIAGIKTSTIPSDGSVTNIGEGAFSGCTALTSITIPDGVTSIGERAFSGCSGLTSVTIPISVTSIGDYAFYYCDELTSITMSDGVTSIGEGAFYYSGLTSITIPDSVTSIGGYAFAYCDRLTSITIPDSVTSIDDRAFYFCFLDIYCEADVKPDGWGIDWDSGFSGTVHWGYEIPDTGIIGDVNNDGKIDQYDYILVKRHYFNTRTLTEDEMTRADANKDGKVDQFDYILIARHYFGTFVIK